MKRQTEPTDEHVVVEDNYQGRWIAVNKHTGRFAMQGMDTEYHSLYAAKDKAEELAKRKRSSKRKAINADVIVFHSHGFTPTKLVRTSARSNYGSRPIFTTMGIDGKAGKEVQLGGYGTLGMGLVDHMPAAMLEAMDLLEEADNLREQVSGLITEANRLLSDHKMPKSLSEHGVNCVEDAIDCDDLLRKWIEEQRVLYPATEGD